nr:hypothetical protein [Tanacetum cinerariifolium]
NALQTLLPQIRAEIREEFRTSSGPSDSGGNPPSMVNTRTDAELAAAVQNALQTLLPQIRAEIREEFRTSSGPSDSGGNPPPVTIHTWLERFNKQKPRSFEKATTTVDNYVFCVCGVQVKEYQENDKIGSKPDKNRKRGEVGKSQKQLQWIKQEKLKKTQKEGPEMQSPTSFNKERKEQGLLLKFQESSSRRGKSAKVLKMYHLGTLHTITYNKYRGFSWLFLKFQSLLDS